MFLSISKSGNQKNMIFRSEDVKIRSAILQDQKAITSRY